MDPMRRSGSRLGFHCSSLFPEFFISATWKRPSRIRSKMTIAISVKNLSKQYRIGAAQQKFRYGMFRDVLVDTLMTPVRIYRALRGQGMQGTNGTATIWALNDVSFDLEERSEEHTSELQSQSNLVCRLLLE